MFKVSTKLSVRHSRPPSSACVRLPLMPPPHHVPSIASILCSPNLTPPSSNETAMDTPPNVNATGGSDPSSTQPDTRPPGGTRRSGNKTPRRVQWMFDEGQATSSPRALDEHGLDVRLRRCSLLAPFHDRSLSFSPRRLRPSRMHSNAIGPHQ